MKLIIKGGKKTYRGIQKEEKDRGNKAKTFENMQYDRHQLDLLQN